jgi:mono/diheme cytochrome c family protein
MSRKDEVEIPEANKSRDSIDRSAERRCLRVAWGRVLSTAVWTMVGVLMLAAVIGTPLSPATGAAMITTNLSGSQLYALACASCHGLSGQGRTFSMDSQTIKVPAITYTALSKIYTKNFDEQLRASIVMGLDEEGKPLNGMMPRWTRVSSADVAKLIAYIKTLK